MTIRRSRRRGRPNPGVTGFAFQALFLNGSGLLAGTSRAAFF